MSEDVKNLIAEAEELIREDEQYLAEQDELDQGRELLKAVFKDK